MFKLLLLLILTMNAEKITNGIFYGLVIFMHIVMIIAGIRFFQDISCLKDILLFIYVIIAYIGICVATYFTIINLN